MLDIVELSKSYDSFRALDNVSFSIGQGSFTTILGPSGSGKSTLLLAISGFVAPSSGDIRLNGKSLLHMAPETRNFGVVFQGYALFPHLRVGENVAFPLQMRGVSRASAMDRVRKALDQVKLLNLIDRYPRELSGGQQQRVALARALVFDPALVLLDEPLSALDKNLRDVLREELRRLHQEIGMTFVLVTHDQEEALEMSDRVAIINHGRLEQYDVPSALYEAPATRFVAQFLGKSSLIKVTPTGQSGPCSSLQAGGYMFKCSRGTAHPSTPSTLMLRPEHLRLIRQQETPCVNAVPGTVVDRSYRGAEIAVTVTTDIGDLLVRLPTGDMGAAPGLGEKAIVSWSETAGYLLPEQDN